MFKCNQRINRLVFENEHSESDCRYMSFSDGLCLRLICYTGGDNEVLHAYKLLVITRDTINCNYS